MLYRDPIYGCQFYAKQTTHTWEQPTIFLLPCFLYTLLFPIVQDINVLFSYAGSHLIYQSKCRIWWYKKYYFLQSIGFKALINKLIAHLKKIFICSCSSQLSFSILSFSQFSFLSIPLYLFKQSIYLSYQIFFLMFALQNQYFFKAFLYL